MILVYLAVTGKSQSIIVEYSFGQLTAEQVFKSIFLIVLQVVIQLYPTTMILVVLPLWATHVESGETRCKIQKYGCLPSDGVKLIWCSVKKITMQVSDEKF